MAWYDEKTNKDNPEKYEPYANYLRDNCTREGEDMFGDEGHLYDFHYHAKFFAVLPYSNIFQ